MVRFVCYTQRGVLILAGSFAPLDPTGHVYSSDLPREGIEGAGRPTLIEVANQASLHILGPLQADHEVLLQRFPGFIAPFPIYPDGPVTLRLPVEPTANAPAQAELVITYMTCSSRGFCLPPVLGKRLLINLPTS